MSFPTLSRRGRSASHLKQSSFDVSELAAAGRINGSTSSDMSALSGRLSPLNPFKRLTQFFKRQSSDSTILHTSTSSESQIFGRCLSEICNPELPKPIKDLLIFLQDVGPFTREIFRKPPNARKCRLLSEKLNAPNFYWEVDESCNGLLLAAVLKAFLREIPNKLCDDRLFNQWAAIFQSNDNPDAKVVTIQRLVSRLPERNQILLKQLVSVLYRIQQHSPDNLMSSYNISVCLGPCLLWTKSSSCRDAEKASKVVPKIVQFLIDHCLDIFGRDILKKSPHMDSALAKKASKSLDSIFTEKPNRYIDIEGLTNQLSRQQMSPSRLSYDSGLILDDMSHDGEESSNDAKTSTPIHKRFDLSYDSLDCDECVFDEEINEHNSKHNNNNTNLYVNTSELAAVKLKQQSKDEVDSSTTGKSVGDLFMPKTPAHLLAAAHKRNTVQVLKRATRPSILPPLVERKPSVLYDKITYRYISDNNQNQLALSSTDKFYSLPRPIRRSRTAGNISLDLEHRPQPSSSQCNHPLNSVTCGQAQWKSPDVPLIVVDSCKQDMQPDLEQHIYINSNVKQYKPANYNNQAMLLPVAENIYQNTGGNNRRSLDIPIYENSELYGPNLTMNRHRSTDGSSTTSPLYENLPFHRQQPIARQRRRTLNTAGSYSTYKQQNYAAKTQLRQNTINRSPTITGTERSTSRRNSQSISSTQFFHETCYFV